MTADVSDAELALREDEERRWSARFQVKVPVRVRTRNGQLSLLCDNANSEGIFVRTDNPAQLRELLEIEISLPDGSAPILALGVVRHVVESADATDSNPPGMGLHFFGIRREERERWERFLSRLTPSGLVAIPGGNVGPVDAIRRRHRRVATPLIAEITAPDLAFTCSTRDISAGGAYLKCANHRLVGTTVELVFSHPNSVRRVTLRGRVTRVDRDGRLGAEAGVAVAFIDPTAEQIRTLDELVWAALPEEFIGGDFLHEDGDPF